MPLCPWWVDWPGAQQPLGYATRVGLPIRPALLQDDGTRGDHPNTFVWQAQTTTYHNGRQYKGAWHLFFSVAGAVCAGCAVSRTAPAPARPRWPVPRAPAAGRPRAVGCLMLLVATCPLAPPLPPVKAVSVLFPAWLSTGTGPVAPCGPGKAVPPGVTRKCGALGRPRWRSSLPRTFSWMTVPTAPAFFTPSPVFA